MPTACERFVTGEENIEASVYQTDQFAVLFT